MALETPTVLTIGTSQSAVKHVCQEKHASYILLYHVCMSDTAGAIRLWNGSFSGPAGRLEVFLLRSTPSESLWTTICAQGGIDQSAADVACRQLGYERAYDYGSAASLG